MNAYGQKSCGAESFRAVGTSHHSTNPQDRGTQFSMISEPSARPTRLDGTTSQGSAAPGLPQRLRWVAAACSQPGVRRHSNQDAHYLTDTMVILADGMGGVRGGATASATALTATRELLSIEAAPLSAEHLRRAVRAAHEQVRLAAAANSLPGMGTTLTVAVFDARSRLLLAHCGDTRAYLLRQGRLIRLTQDHVNRWTDQSGANRSGLTRCVGGSGDTARPDLTEAAVQPGDRLLFCSDGLYGHQTDERLRETLSNVGMPALCSAQLVRDAVQAGSTDDLTAIVADVVPAA